MKVLIVFVGGLSGGGAIGSFDSNIMLWTGVTLALWVITAGAFAAGRRVG